MTVGPSDFWNFGFWVTVGPSNLTAFRGFRLGRKESRIELSEGRDGRRRGGREGEQSEYARPGTLAVRGSVDWEQPVPRAVRISTCDGSSYPSDGPHERVAGLGWPVRSGVDVGLTALGGLVIRKARALAPRCRTVFQ